jgi:hypothetical protein
MERMIMGGGGAIILALIMNMIQWIWVVILPCKS